MTALPKLKKGFSHAPSCFPWCLPPDLRASLLSACGDLQNPFAEKPFIPSAVPNDFAIIVDENHDTFTNRQHIQQVITANDSMSRTTYTNYRDFNDSIANRFTQETPLSPSQVQAMWNSVGQRKRDGRFFPVDQLAVRCRSPPTPTVSSFRSWPMTGGCNLSPDQRVLRPCSPADVAGGAVRLPITQDAGTPVVGAVPPPAGTFDARQRSRHACAGHACRGHTALITTRMPPRRCPAAKNTGRAAASAARPIFR